MPEFPERRGGSTTTPVPCTACTRGAGLPRRISTHNRRIEITYICTACQHTWTIAIPERRSPPYLQT